MELNKECPKCAGGPFRPRYIAGGSVPRFNAETLADVHTWPDQLKWTCASCGYVTFTPTADALGACVEVTDA